MKTTLLLAADFLERASDPSFGPEINEEYALRWAMMRQAGDPVRELGLAELAPDDADTLSLPAWLWIASSLGDKDPELSTKFVESLFVSSRDPVLRLSIADAVLRHPGLARRYAEVGKSISDQPQSWARDRIALLLDQDDKEGNGLREMTMILLQVDNRPALRLLSWLRRQRPDVVDPIITSLANRLNEETEVVRRRLGLTDE
jgi:hypothetical protein